MTIHHDKLAYGKLAKTSEELSDGDILKMLAKLNGEPEESGDEIPNAGDDRTNATPVKK